MIIHAVPAEASDLFRLRAFYQQHSKVIFIISFFFVLLIWGYFVRQDDPLQDHQAGWRTVAELRSLATNPPIQTIRSGDSSSKRTISSEKLIVPISMNQAGISEWQTIPGIGPKRAEAIMQLKQRLGGFRAFDQLLEVKGIGPKTMERIRPWLQLP